jgi:hypothetical protein
MPESCSWSIHAHQTKSVAAAPSPAECARQLIPTLIQYALGKVDITAVDALVQPKNRTFAHQQAGNALEQLRIDPSLADNPSLIFGSGQVAVSACAP